MFIDTLALAVISLLLLALILITVSTIQTGISPMPSSSKAYKAMKSLIPDDHDGCLIDLGSGWGHLVFRLAKDYPERHVYGYELSVIPWLISRMLQKLLKLENVTFHRKSFFTNELPAQATCICYLCPELMEQLSTHFQETSNRPVHLISNTFALPNYSPSKQVISQDLYRSPVYIYDFYS